MTPEELKEKLQNIDLPEVCRMSEWENITDVKGFLDIQFSIIEATADQYSKTPAWERLLRFYKVISKD